MSGRILGLDYGSKRIGIAVSDELLITAQGRETLERRTPAQDMAAINKIISENAVVEVVVGLPISMDGTHSDKTRETLAFAESLSRSVKVPVTTYDERLTTMQAEKALLEGDMSRSKRKGLRDMVAAQLILQAYLDSRKRA